MQTSSALADEQPTLRDVQDRLNVCVQVAGKLWRALEKACWKTSAKGDVGAIPWLGLWRLGRVARFSLARHHRHPYGVQNAVTKLEAQFGERFKCRELPALKMRENRVLWSLRRQTPSC